MLDVHPAHHAATMWRDFFIHIATIVIGLLIAIGLEQTVEFFHHRHQVARGWFQMIPYFTMKDYYEWAAKHPELSSPSQDNINHARAFSGLPPEDRNRTYKYYTNPHP